ncbi:hypothetical protein DOTSEDRAFT_69519 [Dothistroma septosporum NZE10]|uniref:Mitochondrial K+-H+ exchange-related-domain-containing protein n=1 Tax=Dothistroma septosporum (strain NZE10 / CBS 128990) TaxID=675120 RepID=N1PYX9_DOTSN|nr:hypothetical protein DOTSEDRAFT_69519 [Dothistroma septosporum NZE10]
MRLFLLPISTRRTLIYCERIQEQVTSGQKAPLQERVINKAATTWATWEKADKGWQKQVTVYANKLLRRIPYEEWGLKSIPPATKQRIEHVNGGKLKFECLYPSAFLSSDKVPGVLKALATERQPLHRKRMWTCIAWMPVTIPFTVVPVIPNLPFFYLVFRAWSHYKALYGSRLLEHVTTNNLVHHTASKQMDQLYAAGLLHPERHVVRENETPAAADIERVASDIEAKTKGDQEEVMLLQRWNGKLVAEEFHLPEMELEIERAVEQVELAIEEKNGPQQEAKQEEAGARKTAEAKFEELRK